MGEVIKGRFGKGGLPAIQKPTPSMLEGISDRAKEMFDGMSDEERILALDVLFVKTNAGSSEIIKQAIATGNEMTSYVLDDLRGFQVKEESVRLRLGMLSKTPLEVLCTYLINSDKLQWRQQPHYYGAIFVELDSRVQAIKLYTALDAHPPLDET